MKLWKQASLLATMVVFAGMVASAQNGKGDAAKLLLEDAVNKCPHNFMEHGAARIEQRRQTP